MTESLDRTTLDDAPVGTPVGTIPSPDASTEIPPVSGPSADTGPMETKLPEPENTLSTPPETPPLYEDPSDEDDGEGEWITPTNVALHKSKTLQLIPAQGGAHKKVVTGCMTTDFAMQNVLMHMRLDLVGVDGKKIDKVKTWVLRCHACFKYVPVLHNLSGVFLMLGLESARIHRRSSARLAETPPSYVLLLQCRPRRTVHPKWTYTLRRISNTELGGRSTRSRHQNLDQPKLDPVMD